MSDLRARIHADETLIGVFSDLASPLATELCGRAGFDWIVLDLEHGAATETDLLTLLLAAGNTPMAPIVRPQSAERLRIGRALDLGATGVMLPQLQSAAEVRQAVSPSGFPPPSSPASKSSAAPPHRPRASPGPPSPSPSSKRPP